MKFAEVAVDAPIGSNRTFSYSIPHPMTLALGQAVSVPFGPRTLQGIVFSLTDAPQVPETRDVFATIDPRPLLNPSQLQLAHWISFYYMAPLFECAALMLPPGFRTRLRAYLTLPASSTDDQGIDLTPIQARVIEYLRCKGKVEHGVAEKALGRVARTTLPQLIRLNLANKTWEWDKPRVSARYKPYVRLSEGDKALLQEMVSQLSKRAHRQVALLTYLIENPTPVPQSELTKEFGSPAVKALERRGTLTVEMMHVERDPLEGRAFPQVSRVERTPAQDQAALAIEEVLKDTSKNPRAFLLHGVTGSGKTEVYLKSVETCLALGKRAIVLVPEISLTPQTIQRFASRFPGQVAVLHSRLSQGEQFDQWWRIYQGDYGVVVGSRSALFAPQPDLGLIFLDEEHEWTYKQLDPTPRYHARDVALKLSELTGAVVVLGSATPDVTTYHRALWGSLRSLSLPERISPTPETSVSIPRRGALASVEIVDMRQELKEGNRSTFSRALKKALEDTLDAGDQAILFLNRRGSASYLQCHACGLTLSCRSCDVSLTYHAVGDRLICHYCNRRRVVPDKCPRCLSRQLRYWGLGTQKVTEEVSYEFPGVKVLRWDRDATMNPKAHEDLLNRFLKGEAQVLVGTQMIAKGLHIPSVTLVGAISADIGLNAPDFRSGERAFQILCQVTGRAGRGPAEGRAIIQTFQPDHYALIAAQSQDYRAFYQKEIQFRREHNNPPFSRLVRLLYTHTNPALCHREAQRTARNLRQEQAASGVADLELIGPAPAYPPRIRGHYRWHLILRGPSPASILERVSISQGWAIDIDPVMVS